MKALNTTSRFLALLIAACLAVTVLPISVIAATISLDPSSLTFREGDTSSAARQAVTMVSATPTSATPTTLNWSIKGSGASKYQLYDAASGGAEVATDTQLTAVYVGVANGATLATTDSASVKVTCSDGTASANITVTEAPPSQGAEIKGKASVYSSSGSKDALGSAQIIAYNQRWEYLGYATTETDGTYNIPIPAEKKTDTYIVQASSNFILARLLLNKNEDALESGHRTVTAAELASGVDFAFVNPPQVTGSVVDSVSKSPISGATVSVWDSVKTDSTGKFTAQGSVYATGNQSFYAGVSHPEYYYAYKNSTQTIDIGFLKSGASLDIGTIEMQKQTTGGPFGDPTKNYLALIPSTVSGSEISNATLNMYANQSSPMSGVIEIKTTNDAKFKVNDASGVRIMENGKLVVPSSVTVHPNKDAMTIVLNIQPRKQYQIMFAIQAPPVSSKHTTYDATATVNGTVIGKQIAIINHLTITAPAEIGRGTPFSVYGEVTSESGIAVEVKLTDPEGTEVEKRTAKNTGYIYRTELSALAASRPLGVYLVTVTATKGSAELAKATANIHVVDAPVGLKNKYLKDDFNSVSSTSTDPGSFLTFVGWVDGNTDSMDYRNLEAGVELTGAQNVKSAQFVMKTSTGEFKWNATRTGDVFSAKLTQYRGTGKATISLVVTKTDGTILKYPIGELVILIDPSGYIYDKETNQRIVGATVTLYHKDASGSWVLWDGISYLQQNPMKTDNEGKYGWMVGEGDYEVRVSAPGYLDASTLDPGGYGAINVLPEHKEVNIGLTKIGGGSSSSGSGGSTSQQPPAYSNRSGGGSSSSVYKSNPATWSTTGSAATSAFVVQDADKIKALAAKAKTAGKTVAQSSGKGEVTVKGSAWSQLAGLSFQHDTVANGAVQVRVTIKNPSNFTKDTKVSGYVSGKDVERVKNVFNKHFANKTSILHFDQTGLWGQEIEVAAKFDLSGMNKDNLVFYSYDSKTGKYTQIQNPKYRIDENGYTLFSTALAGNIIVSDGALVKK